MEGEHHENTNRNLPLLLEKISDQVKASPSKVAHTFLKSNKSIERQYTFEEFDYETTSLAKILLTKGYEKGQRIILVYPPSLDFVIAFVSCLKAGLISVPVYPPNPSKKESLVAFCKIVEGCEAKVALTNKSYNHMKKLSNAKAALTSKKKSLTWPDDLTWIVTNDLKLSKSDAILLPNISSEDIAFLQYTSGSTNDPKGVMITHGNLAHNLHLIIRELKASSSTIVVSWLPQYHDMGLIGSYLGILYCGGSGYYISPITYLSNPSLWIELISLYKATHLQAPNFAFKLTSRKFNSYSEKSEIIDLDLSSVQHIINAAEPIEQEAMEMFYNTFGKYGLKRVIYPTYGLAEHTVFVSTGGKQILTISKEALEEKGKVLLAKADDSYVKNTVVGCGIPPNDVNVRIVDQESQNILEEDSVGEIWINSPSKAMGYYNLPQKTKEDFAAMLNSKHYLKTGDLGFIHEKELFICGRIKDLIIVGGRNHYPQDLESTVETFSQNIRPGCSAAFEVDENVVLLLELREVPSSSKDVEPLCEPLVNEIHALLKQEHGISIANIVICKPRTVPKTTSGKIARSWCKKGFLQDTLQIVYRKSFMGDEKKPLEIESAEAPLETKGDSSSLIQDLCQIGSLTPQEIDVNAPLTTQLDSLSISQFKGILEQKYNVKLSDEYLFQDNTTVAKLEEVIRLGYAPDDNDHDNSQSQQQKQQHQQMQSQHQVSGKNKSFGEMLGCPPGVVCCSVM